MFFRRWIILFSLISSITLQANNTADYVIVGVGASGALMANRLSDDNKTSVIALHSGRNLSHSFILKYSKNTIYSTLLGFPIPFDPMSLEVPAEVQKELRDQIRFSNNARRSLYETGVSIPQVSADNRELFWAIPTMLGGSSSVGFGVWCRGTNEMYSHWEAIGGALWSVERIQRICKKMEHYTGKTTSPRVRGYHGSIRIMQDPIASLLANVFSQAEMQATGFPYVLDYNDPNFPIGVSSLMQWTHSGLKGCYRVSNTTAFLNEDVMHLSGKGARGRRLQVKFNSYALRVIWEGNKAVGVEYLQEGILKQVFAKKGVIVCAGLKSSPFLMHSGVGPADLLNSLGIAVIYDNPNVGQGLKDHPHVAALFSANPKDSRAGLNGMSGQVAFLPDPFGDCAVRKLKISTFDLVPGVTAAWVDLCQPKSLGSVRITSANPLTPPQIDLGILSDPSDLALFVSAFQVYVKQIHLQLQTIDPDYRLIYPDPEILDDTALLETFIRKSVASSMFFQGHCRMAKLSLGGVVDFSGRVYGVQNLIVADNSIAPYCTDGSGVVSASLIAETIAEILKENP